MTDMTKKDAAVKLAQWVGRQQSAGASIDQIMDRAAKEPDAVAKEIGIPARLLTTDIFDGPEADDILSAMADAAMADIAASDPTGRFADLLKRTEV